MPVIVAEYLGQRVDTGNTIKPVVVSKTVKPTVICPFKNGHCSKAKAGNKPICSVRDGNTGELWIVCSHRLCATKVDAPLSAHQIEVLHQVVKAIYDPAITLGEVMVKREVTIEIIGGNDYKADYVMSRKGVPGSSVVLEMQGGGETNNTGALTREIEIWEHSNPTDNSHLLRTVDKVASIETNAWRRQQEQFLVKGNVAMQSGGKMVFCVGSKIYDYLIPRLTSVNLPNLRAANWTLAILTFGEDAPTAPRPATAPHSIGLKIDPGRSIFTNYNSFVQALANQGGPSTTLFTGDFVDLTGNTTTI